MTTISRAVCVNRISMLARMKIEQACHVILGDELAHSIIMDMGVEWAVVAAMAQATTDDDPAALAAIDAYNRDRKARQ